MLKNIDQEVERDIDPTETAEWMESLEDVLHRGGPGRVKQLLAALQEKAYREGVLMPFTANTPYINTISQEMQPRYPGNRELERRIKSILRWNAMAMVVRATKEGTGVGGHLASFASAATLYEVGFNHFFRGQTDGRGGDFVYFQGHASPGMYARAFLEGRLEEAQLKNFRRELQPGGGLSSYPHPWLMPNFWQFPTVSMGLGPITAIYHARFCRYLDDRGLKDTAGSHIWCFMGDGECDEPESLGAINMASREQLDNLIFVINCNLQRLDGPVRGNGKIVQELEAGFRGAGWNVIKVLWGEDWDPLLEADKDGVLVKRMGQVVDGQYQKYVVESGAYIRDHFFGVNPKLRALVDHLSDEQLRQLRRGGHDPVKVYAAYQAAVNHVGSPTVILVKTVKGYGLGEAGEGRNIAHQQKKMDYDQIREFRSRFGIPIADDDIEKMPFYKPPADSPEMQYLAQRRKELGGFIPARIPTAPPLEVPTLDDLKEFLAAGKREASTTVAFVRLLTTLLRHKTLGRLIVPIIADEARTFGMEGMFSQFGIYAHSGQLYEPVDAAQLAFYKEAKNGQILQEGINEAGALSSFVAAGTAYANHGLNMIPFYIFYSMFGFQRVGDLIWLAGDSRCRGFLLGGTAGRTTLNGEGLQHEDGHSLLAAAAVPNLLSYDPAFGYELTVIIQDGLRRMYQEQEAVFYYLMVYNEGYPQPTMPEGAREGILRGMYRFSQRDIAKPNPQLKGTRVQLFGSGSILRHALLAQELLAETYGIASDVWSVTSYTELRREGLETDRWNRLHPTEEPKQSYVARMLADTQGPYIAASDYVKLVPEQIASWVPGKLVTLGTDGFGRSDSREALRDHFEIDAKHIAYAALHALAQQGELKPAMVEAAAGELGIDPEKPSAQYA